MNLRICKNVLFPSCGHNRKAFSVIYENIQAIKSDIEVYYNMLVIEDDNLVCFNASHALYLSMAIVWKSMCEVFHIMITYSSEQGFDLKFSRKALH